MESRELGADEDSLFKAFCAETRLHGWQYLAQGEKAFLDNMPCDHWFCNELRPKLARFFWTSIVVLAAALAAVFLYNNTEEFMHAPAVTTVDTMTAKMDDIVFPAVVVCNINQIRDSFFTSPDSFFFPPSDTNSSSSSMQQPCRDMLVYERWAADNVDGHRSMEEREVGTDYGICCWYTSNTSPGKGPWFTRIRKGVKTGKANGYTLLLDVESFEYQHFHHEGSEGLKVALVHPLDMPIMRLVGFHIAPGTESQIAISFTLVSTTQTALSWLDPVRRDCYDSNEIGLKHLRNSHGYRYEMRNCLFEAALQHIIQECKCFPDFRSKTGIPLSNLSSCLPKDQPCVNEHMNRIGVFEDVEYQGRRVKCRSSCEDQINSVFVTASAFPNKRVFAKRPEFCLTVSRLISKCDDVRRRRPLTRSFPALCESLEKSGHAVRMCEHFDHDWQTLRPLVNNCTEEKCHLEELVFNYARKNLAVLNIFIKDMYAKRFVKDVRTRTTAFIANSGKLLCLCMGFSLISLAEVLFMAIAAIFPEINQQVGEKRRSVRRFYERHCQPCSAEHHHHHHHLRRGHRGHLVQRVQTRRQLPHAIAEDLEEEQFI